MNDQVQEQNPGSALVAQASPDQMAANMQRMSAMIKLKRQFLNDNLAEGIDRDYAVIPGTNKLSLLKPGAEKLLDWHGYYAKFILINEKEDWEIGLFAYVYRCEIRQKGSNTLVADCEGDASSFESKYRFEWKYSSELPKGIDKDTLVAKEFGRGDKKTVKYQVIVANPADKRNTVRKMSQKRALIGATVLATATSDLFAADVEPGEDGEQTEPTGNGGSKTTSAPAGDHGDPISEPQAKRLYAIRKSNNIDDGQFKAWLKAKYGIDDDRAIGRKVYEEICKACESGHLEMPKPAQSATEPEKSGAGAAPVAGAKITVPQIKDVNMLLGELKQTEAQFRAWLAEAFPQYAGKGINDLLSADVDAVKAAFRQWATGEIA